MVEVSTQIYSSPDRVRPPFRNRSDQLFRMAKVADHWREVFVDCVERRFPLPEDSRHQPFGNLTASRSDVVIPGDDLRPNQTTREGDGGKNPVGLAFLPAQTQLPIKVVRHRLEQ